jgi:uncharacterized protein YdaU (DUF1376 family)
VAHPPREGLRVNFYKHYIGDFQRDTGHLSLTERGAYLCLMHHYYATEKPLPNDHAALCRIAGALEKAERDAVRAVMAFFTPVDSGLMHSRIEAELQRAGDVANTNREIALAREAKRRAEREERSEHEQSTKRAQSVPRSDHEQSTNQTPDTKKTVSKPSASHPPAGGLAAGFDEFWLAWPKGERKQDKAKCLDYWKRNGLAEIAETVLADVRLKRGTRKWADGFIEAPLVYLRGKRWEDGVEPEVGPVAGAEPLTVPSKAAEQTARELAEQDARAAALRTPEEQERARQALARARSALKVVA